MSTKLGAKARERQVCLVRHTQPGPTACASKLLYPQNGGELVRGRFTAYGGLKSSCQFHLETNEVIVIFFPARAKLKSTMTQLVINATNMILFSWSHFDISHCIQSHHTDSLALALGRNCVLHVSKLQWYVFNFFEIVSDKSRTQTWVGCT